MTVLRWPLGHGELLCKHGQRGPGACLRSMAPRTTAGDGLGFLRSRSTLSDPDNDGITYEYEVYSDSGLSSKVNFYLRGPGTAGK